MRDLVRAFIVVLLASCSASGVLSARAHAQATGVLRIRVALAGDKPTVAVPRHVLLVSDNPASRVPWRIIVAPDGTGRVTLPAGNYTVESEEPLLFQGRAFEWRETLDVAAGADTLLELTTANAAIAAPPPTAAATGTGAGTLGVDPWDVLLRWQDSVVALWTPTVPASGVVIAPTGLIATNQRVVGSATSVEVQLGPAMKVAARVLAADAARDVAILWADPAALASRPPVPTGCDLASRPAIERGQSLTAIGSRPGGQPYPTPGKVLRFDPGSIATAFDFTVDSTGGPVFAAGGVLVGVTSVSGASGDEVRVVRIDAVCEVLSAAEARMKETTPPSATPLPIEPSTEVSEAALAGAAKRRAGSLNPYRAASDDFDIAFITPVVAHAGRQATMDFGNWSGYVAGAPAVLLVRVTPKQVEPFWKTVARGAAMTQGIALPAFKTFKPGFASMRVTCGGAEVVPIHPLLVERRISETAAVREGLYVFAPEALAPSCGTVTLEIASEKTPDRRDTVGVDPAMLQQIARDFAEYRALQPSDAPPRGAK